MKIAVLPNLYKPLSENTTGGTELFAYLLIQELSKRPAIDSIDVYGCGNNPFTDPKIHFISVLDTPIGDLIKSDPHLSSLALERPSLADEIHQNAMVKLYAMLITQRYDIIHNNTSASVFTSMDYLKLLSKTPVVTTIHTNLSSPSIIIPLTLNLMQNENHFFVPIAHHQVTHIQKQGYPLSLTEPVYNGINIERIPFQQETGRNEYGLWLGRVEKKHNKGLKDALIATKKLNIPLTVVQTIENQSFYDQEIHPSLHDKVTTYTTVSLSEKMNLYQHASYFIYPILWEEPFGLVFLEALASGTPVIAYAKGAVPEIIEDGINGFIVNSSDQDIRGSFMVKKTGTEGLMEAIQRIQTMSQNEYVTMRKAARARVQNYFTIKHMVDGYQKVYNQLIAKPS